MNRACQTPGRGASPRVLAVGDQLVWIDCEMTGLDLTHDVLIEVAALVTIELGAEGDQLLDPPGPLVDEHPHGVQIAQPGAGGEGVGEVQVDLLGIPCRRSGNTSLSPPRRRLIQLALGEHPGDEVVLARCPHRR